MGMAKGDPRTGSYDAVCLLDIPGDPRTGSYDAVCLLDIPLDLTKLPYEMLNDITASTRWLQLLRKLYHCDP